MPFQDSYCLYPGSDEVFKQHSQERHHCEETITHQDIDDRSDARGCRSSVCGSAVDSTDDGMLTPTCTVEENHPEANCRPVSAATNHGASVMSGGRIRPASPMQVQTNTTSSVRLNGLDIEQEISRRVEAELAARELAALRKEKQEWLENGETERREWQHKFAMEKESNKHLAEELATLKTAYTQRKAVEDALAVPKAPIRFKDAVGRSFSFPFHLASTWSGVSELLKQAFLHVDVLGPHVNDGHYDLICTSGRSSGEYILPQVWEAVVEPGWQVTMHMWPLPGMPQSVGSTLSSIHPLPTSSQEKSNSRTADPWHRKVGTAESKSHTLFPPSSLPPPPPPPCPAPGASFKAVRPDNDRIAKTYSGTVATIYNDISMGEANEGHSFSSTHSRSPSIISTETTNVASFQKENEAMAALKTLIDAKRVFVVGKVGSMGRKVVQVQVKPKRTSADHLIWHDRLASSQVKCTGGPAREDRGIVESQALNECKGENVGQGEGEGEEEQEKPAWARSVGHIEMAPGAEGPGYNRFQAKPTMYWTR
ncbi:hypothetical protein VTL71DRAFT_8871 [Oculimacula yallundae]|uniref:Ubiquitin-like domain-containing protein n=1 Tax=Oculimacula yallundae TaxID=86028 RepID=A0ABR4BT56_9HELO